MTWQTPDGDPPPEPGTPPPDPVAPEPDAETARVPVPETPPEDPVPPAHPQEPAQPLAPPPAGLISAAPVGWTDPAQSAPGAAPAGGPTVGWVAPAPRVAATVATGVVIAGVFPRLVAYSVDVLLLFALNVVVEALLGVYAGGDERLTLVVNGVFIGVDFLYFVGLWTSGWQATVGMRLLKLRVLDANTAGTLPANEALLRWLALSGAFAILNLVPGLAGTLSLLGFVWLLALLFSTVMNRLHQGLHDRWARSVVVQPAPGGSGAALVTCLVLVVLVVLVLPLIFLAVAGDQIQSILSQIGQSV
jgi:uncharacterized RDD family membrane protein YckC